MVQFVGVRNVVDLVNAMGVETFLKGLAQYVEADFRRWNEFDKVARIAAHSADGVIELMPASDKRNYGFKYVNGHPKNPLSGRQTVTAFGVFADVETGYPQFLSEMTITTALRTAVTSAIAAKYLARGNARTMAVIGLGGQSEFQAAAFATLLGISKLRVYDIDRQATAKFRSNIGRFGLDVVYAESAEDAVLGADIVTTVTADKQNATVLSDNMIGAGLHINAVGGDCPGKTELQRDILLRAEVFVEYAAQTRIEGEIQQMAPDFPVTELWRVIAGEAPGRISNDQITIFDSVGFAIEDFSTLRYVRDHVQGTQFYTELDLIAEPEDPRNLFGLFGSADGRPHQRESLR